MKFLKLEKNCRPKKYVGVRQKFKKNSRKVLKFKKKIEKLIFSQEQVLTL